MFGAGLRGGPLVSGARCPLTVRLTGGLWEVIDWLVPGPPRALAAALEVGGSPPLQTCFLLYSGTTGRKAAPNPRQSPLLFCPPPPSPSALHPGKMGEATIRTFFLSFASVLRYLLKLLFKKGGGGGGGRKKMSRFFRF